jgi:hypothetical protein
MSASLEQGGARVVMAAQSSVIISASIIATMRVGADARIRTDRPSAWCSPANRSMGRARREGRRRFSWGPAR